MSPLFHHHTSGGETDSRATDHTKSAHQRSSSRTRHKISSSRTRSSRRRHHRESPVGSKRRRKSSLGHHKTPDQSRVRSRSRLKLRSKERSKLRSRSLKYSDSKRKKSHEKKRTSVVSSVNTTQNTSKSPKPAAYPAYGGAKPNNRYNKAYHNRVVNSGVQYNQDLFVPDPPGAGAKGPPMPFYPPMSRAALRVLILVGLISSKVDSSESIKFSLNCPIHSMAVARIIRSFFRFARNVPSFVLKRFSSSLIASEIIALSKPIIDPIAGEVPAPLCVEILKVDAECVLETFDFLRSNFIVRTALSREHPSNARIMWDPNLSGFFQSLISKKELWSGIGLGVEVTSMMPAELEAANHKPHTPHNNHLYYQSECTNQFKPYIETPFGLHQSSSSNNPLIESPAPSIPASNNLRRLPPPPPPLTGLHPHLLPPPPPPPSSTLGMSISNDAAAGFLQPPVKPPGTASINLNPSSSIPGCVPSIVNEDTFSLEKLLSAPSAKEQQAMESNSQLLDLFAAPTAKHSITARTFQNRGGSRVQQICPHGTRHECLQASIADNIYHSKPPSVCHMVHFKRILLPHTDLSLGDCSYLDTCRHMSTCRFVHYEVDLATGSEEQRSKLLEQNDTSAFSIGTVISTSIKEVPAQWITCDVSNKIKIVMADPPWDIHMDLPYGTMTDAEMKSLKLDLVQEEGLLFLWVTGRAMELGRECMSLWGYKQVEELVWVKTNQLHRIIRTGRTGHWLNHSKEHCLVGIKKQPKLNRHVDVDVIVAEVRETSRKPDEIYRIIERLSPGPYKLELFGRPNNVRNNWITLGNQLKGVYLHDEQIIERYNEFAEENNIPLYQRIVDSDKQT